jgi:DNA-binding transcriptional MerR regulator
MFGPDALERLLFIGRLKNLGLTLEEIGTLNQSFDRGKTAAMLGDLESLLHDRRLEVAARIKELQHLDQELAAYQKRIRTKRNS